MSITLHFNAEIEQRLRGEAARNKLPLQEYLEQLVVRAIAVTPSGAAASSTGWETAWRTWAAGHKASPSDADDDRDAIYAGRGE